MIILHIKREDVGIIENRKAKNSCSHNYIKRSSMNNIMAVLLEGIAQIEYNRDLPLPDHQVLYLDKMDEKMDAGITIGEELISKPDLSQRAQFVAGNLAHAIITDDEATTAALCSWLADRLPDLKQIKIIDEQGNISVELVFDEDYKKQVEVKFTQLH